MTSGDAPRSAVRAGCVLVVAAWLLLALPPVHAQTGPTPGNCEPGQAEAWLDHNNVRALILNDGTLFWPGFGESQYEVPANEGVGAIYLADMWMAGVVDGEIRASGGGYSFVEIWPGPLLPGGTLPDENDCSAYDRIFEITADDLNAFVLTDETTENLRSWPWHLGAPVVDGDGIPGNYDLSAGDLPEIVGHQRLWWVLNDVGNEHWQTESKPLGVEVQVSAAVASRPGTAIDHATVFTFRYVNRTHASIDSMFVAVYTDTDLGAFFDDYVGMDTTVGMAFTYNADNFDEGSEGYGEAPPAVGLTLVKGWPADADGMDNDFDGLIDESGEEAGIGHLLYFPHGPWSCPFCSPKSPADYYNYMNGVWKDGVPLTVGGVYGRDHSSTPSRHSYPGDPVTGSFWSEVNIDGDGTANRPGYRSWMLSFGPFNLPPGEHAEFTFAYVWARGKDNLDSITELRRAARAIQDTYEEAIVHAWKPPEKPVVRYENTTTRLHPNPASGYATLRYTVSTTAEVRAELFDAWGRRMRTVVGGTREPGEYSQQVDLTGLAPGLYLYRMAIGRAESTGSLVVVR